MTDIVINTPNTRISDYVCWDCGTPCFTDLQLITYMGVVTASVSTCGLCEQRKATTHYRNFNYLKPKRMNFRELRRGMIVIQNSLQKLQSMTSAETGNTSREIASAFTSTQLAMMWTGKLMGYAKLGDNPYAENDGNRKTVDDIKPLFDATDELLSDSIFEQGRIYTIDQIREYFDKQVVGIHDVLMNDDFANNLTDREETFSVIAAHKIITNIIEAGMWLGMELGRIRDTEGK